MFIAPLFIWLVIIISCLFKGARFLIIPVYFGLFLFGYYIVTQRTIKHLILFWHSCIVLFPFIQMFPIGLGLKVLFGSAILTVLSF
jgi:hypothetical protein